MNKLAKDFFAIKDIKKIEIDLSEFGGPKEGLFAKTLSAEQSSKIHDLKLKPGVDPKKATPEDYEMDEDIMYKMIVASCCDQDGKNVFDSEMINALKEKSSKLILFLNKKVSEANGFTEKDIEIEEKK